MQVRATYIFNFDADVDDIDPEYVDIKGLAIDLIKGELSYLLKNQEVNIEDFDFEIIDG